jgi:hypothetical protein
MANAIYSALPTTIFTVMSGLAREMGAINLGQGFPDEPGPEAIRRAAAEAVLHGNNQYPPMPGIPELREAVARHYARRQGLDLDWKSEITVTSGATEALACAFLALIEPGDEVVLFQPMYDAYLPMVRRAGGVPRLARLQPPHWRFDRAMLDGVFSERLRRGVGTGGVRQYRPPAADRLSRHARADGEDRVGRQDVRPDRLEGGIPLRRPGDHRGASQGAPVPDLHHAAQSAERGGLGAGQQRRLVRQHAPRPRRLT